MSLAPNCCSSSARTDAAPIGAVTCYRLRQFTPEDELLLEAIGTQAAAGVLSLSGTERTRPAVSELLSASRGRGWRGSST